MSNAPGRRPAGGAWRVGGGRSGRGVGLGRKVPWQQRVRADHADHRQTRGDEERQRHVDVAEKAAERGPEEEADAERHADHAERLRAVLRLGVIGDVGLRERQVAGGHAVEHATGEHHPQRRRAGQHEEADARPGLAQQEQRPAPVAVGQAADDRRRDQRAHRVDRYDRRRDQGGGSEFLGEQAEQRDHDREAEDIDQHDQEDRQERRPPHHSAV